MFDLGFKIKIVQTNFVERTLQIAMKTDIKDLKQVESTFPNYQEFVSGVGFRRFLRAYSMLIQTYYLVFLLAS